MATVEQFAIDSWYFISNAPETKYENQSLYVRKDHPDYYRYCESAIVIGPPSASKKEIVYDSLRLGVYITALDNGGDIGGIVGSLNLDKLKADSLKTLYGLLLMGSFAVGSYNNIQLLIQNTSAKESVYRSFFNSNSKIYLYPLYDKTSPDEQVVMRSDLASSGKPKLIYTANDIVPVISNLSPQSGNIAAAVASVFSYTFTLPAVSGYVHQMPVFSSAEMQWKVKDSSTVNTRTSTTNGQFSIPAGTFAEGTIIQWRMRAKTDDNIYSAWSSWYTVTVDPLVTNISPQAGNIIGSVDNNFTFGFGLTTAPSGVQAAPIFGNAEMEWKLSSGGTVYTRATTTKGKFVIPAGTFTNSTTIMWRMRAKTSIGVYGAWSNWFTITVGDLALTATAISPVGQFVDATKAVVFMWGYSSGIGRKQAGFEAQISYDSGSGYVALFSGTGEAKSYTLPANTLAAGGFKWKIRVKNDLNTWSPYSAELSNRVVAAPSTPIIAAADGSTSRPELVWQTDTQLAFQVKVLAEGDVLVYESGTVNSNERRHTIREYLADGTYMVMVRAQNEYMYWSEWGAGVITIDTAASKPTAPELLADSFENYVQLRFIGVDDTIETLIIYRDGKPIAQILPSNSTWEDYTCDAEVHTYFVRVTRATMYADTAPVSGQPVIKGRLLAAVGDPENILNLKYRRGERPAQVYNYASGVVLNRFEGRSRPCGDRPDAADFGLSFDASVLEAETVFALIALADRCETVIYRDGSGVKMFAQLDVIKPTIMKRYSDIQISMTQVDYSEVITIA